MENEEQKNSHTYVPLTPDTKNGETKETASETEDKTADTACAQESQEQDSGELNSSEQDSGELNSSFTPLSQQLSQAAEAEEETVEEFFNEDTENTEAPEKAE